MPTLTFLNARHGDACLVTWPDGDRRRTMLVDGGPADTYGREILPHLSASRLTDVDVACVTHIDDDHVAGIVRLLADIDRTRTLNDVERIRVHRLWFNDVEELVDDVEPGLSASVRAVSRSTDGGGVPASLRQAHELRRLSVRLGLTGNPPFEGLVRQGSSESVHGLHVTAVTPDGTAINRLAAIWRQARRHQDAGVVAAAFRDRSVPNLSSITLHLSHCGRSVLLTGDARGDHILAGLAASNVDHAGGPLRLDVLKLPHHGSARSVTPAFFQRVRADHYVISADGRKHGHPDEQTLRWLVESRSPNDRYTVHLTNMIEPALAVLGELGERRSFNVNVRREPDRSIVITI